MRRQVRDTTTDSGGQRKHWLCVAYAFPPVNRSGTHRTLAFVRHLDRLGWDATAITVQPTDEPIDASLLERIPASTTVKRTPCRDLIDTVKQLPFVGRAAERSTAQDAPSPSIAPPGESKRSLRDWASRLLTTPDSKIGWIRSAVSAGLEAVARRRPDVIYSTSPCMSAHLIALILSWRTGVPWVADFRDPWRGNPFRDLRYRTVNWWDAWLERRVLARASHIICNTSTATNELIRRMPLVGGKCTAIPNGYDREQFDRVAPTRIAPVETFVMTHCGQFYGPRSPKRWFRALRRVIEDAPRLARRLQFALIGSEQFDGRPLCELAEEAGVANQVRVLGPMSHADTLSHMAGSDALVLAGSTGAGAHLQVPNKLFEYLAVRRPIIAAVAPHSPVVDILREARAVAHICDPDDDSGLASVIQDAVTGRRAAGDDAWEGVPAFARSRRAAELAAVFEGVSAGRDSVTGRVVRTAESPRGRVERARGDAESVQVTQVFPAESSVDA